VDVFTPLQLGEFCRRLGIPERAARYAFEQGCYPEGVDEAPGKGDHRQLTAGQCVWLAVLLRLKESGLKLPLARVIADRTRDGVRGVARQLNWDGGFAPFDGRLATAHQWYVEVGDSTHMRLVTDANPSHRGLYEFDWVALAGRKGEKAIRPVVVIRVDLTRIAELVRG
jgi:hypothetical protein